MVKASRLRYAVMGFLSLSLFFSANGLCRAADDLLSAMESADQQPRTTSASTTHVAPLRKRTQQSEEEFIPLLAPLTRTSTAASRSENLFHGRIRERELYVRLNNGTYDLVSRLDSNGSLDRIEGQAVSFVWNGQLSRRQGTSYTTANDYQHTRLRMFEAAFNEKFKNGVMAREGRFLPSDLPGMGYVDGLQVQNYATNHLQIGAAAGARPERRELGLSIREPIASTYAVYEHGIHGEMYYAGSLGVYQTLFNGVKDESALLYDQRSDLGPKLNLWLSSQVNFNTGAAVVNTELARLTRADLNLSSPLTQSLVLRAGLNHFELPDTAAQRDLAGTSDPSIFETGYWRYWTGSTQHLPWQMNLDEEFDLISSPGRPDLGQVRGTVSRQGVFLPQALVSFTAYTLNRVDSDGVGGLFSVVFPLMDNRLNLNASAGLRYSGPQGESKSLQANDASIYVNWLITRNWVLDLGVTQTYQDAIQSTLIDSGLSYRW